MSDARETFDRLLGELRPRLHRVGLGTVQAFNTVTVRARVDAIVLE